MGRDLWLAWPFVSGSEQYLVERETTKVFGGAIGISLSFDNCIARSFKDPPLVALRSLLAGNATTANLDGGLFVSYEYSFNCRSDM